MIPIIHRPRRITNPILAAFDNGEQGAYYDFCDASTMWQAYYGIDITTTGQLVGSVIDIKRGATYTQYPTTGWVKTIGDGVVTVIGNQVTITGATTITRVMPTINRPAEPGRIQLTATLTSISGGGSLQIYGSGIPTSLSSPATATMRLVTASPGNDFIQLTTGSCTFTIDAYEWLPGNHLQQQTSAQRPTWEWDGTVGAIVGDAIDKHLRTVAALDMSHTDKITVMVVVNRNGDENKLFASQDVEYVDPGSWYFSTESTWRFNVGDSSGRQRALADTPDTSRHILVSRADRAAADPPDLRVDGINKTGTIILSGDPAGNYTATRPLALLARWSGTATSFASAVKLSKFLIIDRLLTDIEVAAIEAQWASETGVTLP